VGEVVPIARTRCPCGWRYPTEVQVVVAREVEEPMSVRFVCPGCGRCAETATLVAPTGVEEL